jgi:hypothetical protein
MAAAAACGELLEAVGLEDGEAAVAEVLVAEAAAPEAAPDWLAAPGLPV